MPKRAVRLHSDLDERLQHAVKERGFRTPSAFIRAAIESKLTSRTQVSGLEEQTAASFSRLSEEIRRVRRDQQALFAVIDALAKVILTCVPEPPRETREQSIALARDRYARLMKTAGYAMGNEVRSAMQGLTENGDE